MSDRDRYPTKGPFLRAYAPRTSERLSEDLRRFSEILLGKLDDSKGGVMLDRTTAATISGLLDEASRRTLFHRVDDMGEPEYGHRVAPACPEAD